MAFVHGKNTFISLNAADLSPFTNTSSLERTADSHDVTTYGSDSHVKQGGLFDGSASIGGIYDNSTSGPRDIIEPLLGTVVSLIRRPEGEGSGLPEDTVNVLVQSYTETSPVAEMVTWECALELSGDVTSTDQV